MDAKQIIFQLKEEIKIIKNLRKEEHLFSIHTAFTIIKNIIDCNIHCIAYSQSRENYAPGLSFSIIDREIRVYTSNEAIKKQKEISDNLNTLSSKSDNYLIHIECYSSIITADDRQKIGSCLNKICDLIRGDSLNLRNLEYDQNQIKLEKLRVSLSTNFTLENLCEFIGEEEKIECVHSFVNNSYDIELTSSTKNENLAISDLFKDYESEEYKRNYRHLVSEVIEKGKPIIGSISKGDFNINFILIPMIRNSDRTKRITHVLVIYNHTHIKKNTLGSILSYIDLYLNYRFTQSQVNILMNMQNSLLSLNPHRRWPSIDGKNSFLLAFKEFLEINMSEILFCTYGHSISIRLYGHKSKSLDLFVSNTISYGKSSEYREDTKELSLSIKISKYRSSVNAFTFATCTQEEPFVYIPNLLRQSSDNSDDKFSETIPQKYKEKGIIPQKYKEKGLQAVAAYRKNSASEICFILTTGNTPFGVMNIESQVRDAFDDFKGFLSSVTKLIEAYFSQLLLINDNQWICDRISFYGNIHELRQRRELGHFTKKGSKILDELLFVDEQKKIESEKINISSLQKIVENLINANHSTLDDNTRSEIHKTVSIKICSQTLIDYKYINNITDIVKNLISNIVAHGDLEKDRIRITDERLTPLSSQIFLRLFVKSTGDLDSDIVDKMGIRPISKEKERYGMFLVGMIVRMLGGTIDITKARGKKEHHQSRTLIEIRIPMESLKNE
jgi:hypothetical protein